MSSSSPTSVLRVSVLAVIGLLVVGAGVGLGVSTLRRGQLFSAPDSSPATSPTSPPAAVAAPMASVASPPQASAPKPAAPSFDVVRVTPDGSAVLAGRAEPGAMVTVRENGATLGHAQADGHGSWVMVAGTKLQPGASELTVSAQTGSAAAKTADTPVLVVVPSPVAPSAPAMALLAPRSAPSTLLQAPAPAAPGSKLGLDTVDYDEHGAIRFSGSAPPDASVRVYVDNGPVGDAKAGTDGHWSMSPPDEVQPGVHTLRLDQLTGQGRVAARIEMPFERVAVALSQVANGQVVVQPGQNLWRLARRAYGAGIRYTVIFMANRDQIRDARLIYPGQIFAVPDAPPPAATPAAAR